MKNGVETTVMAAMNLKRSYRLVSAVGSSRAELRDSARGNQVVFAGTYKECVAEAKRRGIWYS